MRMDQGTWVLVADGEKFLLLRNVGNRARVALEVIDPGAVDNPPTRAQGTDRPGRLDHAAAGPSTVQETDWHRLEKERFAKDLADACRDGRSRAGTARWCWSPTRGRSACCGRSCTRRCRSAPGRGGQGPHRNAGIGDRGGAGGRLTDRVRRSRAQPAAEGKGAKRMQLRLFEKGSTPPPSADGVVEDISSDVIRMSAT